MAKKQILEDGTVQITMSHKEFKKLEKIKTINYRGWFNCTRCGELTSPESPNTRTHGLCWMCR